jgi:hypothetical protein
VIELCVRENHSFDRDMPDGRGLYAGRKTANLIADVRRRVEEEPPLAVAADGD